MDMEERGAFVWSGEAYLCYSLSGLFVFGLIACCFLWFKRVLKRTRTGPEPEQEAREDAEFRQNKMPRLMQRERFREADWDVGSSSSSSRSCWQGNTNKKFEVFISHRGPDTKDTLAQHIYDLLRYRGVGVFLDREELEAGERLPKAIEEAIQCSRVHLCILSSGYTESVWCLKELEMMMHRYEIGASEIIPIFYDVKPFQVRYLKGAMGQGMKKQKQRMEKQKQRDPREIDQWIDALRKIADIKGYEGKGSVAMEVTDRICELLDVGSLAISKNVVGISNQVEGLKDDITRRRKEGHDVTSVEITGIGGIGKTTLAKILYNKIYYGYTRSCFIEDVNGLVEKSGVNAVHKQISSDLFGYDPNLRESSAKQSLKSKLKDEEILIVLDNINKENCVSAVFIEDGVSLQATSTIIVTSREQGVLEDDPHISSYRRNLIALQISKLPFEVSKELFCQYAFEGSRCCFDPRQDDLMNKIISKCDGIPLALALFGKHVKHVYDKHVKHVYGKHVDGKDLQFWKDFWASIKHTLPSDITKILRFTYDHLDTDLEKCLFLDVAIFFRGETVELLRNIKGESDEDDGKVSVALFNLERKLLINLERKLLIDISYDPWNMLDRNRNRLNMHGLLVDLGRTIVMNESSCPGHRSRLWHPSDVRKVLSEERGTDKVKGLSLVWRGSAVLDEDENGNPCAWSADVFVGMSSMELLILEGSCIEGDFSKLSKKLVWLRWTNFPFEKIPRTLCIKRLRKLDLWDGQKMTHLWEHSPKEAPANLRKLDVHNCTKLQRLPEFNKKFKQLSSIVLDGCQSLEHIPDSFGQLQGLEHLKLRSCGALQLLPETIGDLNSLIKLKIENCSKLKLLPMSLGKLGQLQKLLLLECNALEQLPETIGDLNSLFKLKIDRCSKLKSLPMSLGKLGQLQKLLLLECYALEQLPKTFGDLIKLQQFTALDCGELKSLPSSFSRLPQISKIFIDFCPNLAIDEDRFEQITSLRDLGLWRCKVPKLPWKVGQQNHLRTLQVCNDDRRSIWSPRNVPSLASFSETEVEELSLNTENLKDLYCLYLENISFTHLPVSMENLTALRSLYLCQCFNLRELPESVAKLSKLTVLQVEDCPRLRQLPSCTGNLSHLTKLSVTGCCNLKELPKSIDGLSSLEVLALDGCSSLQEVPLTIGNLSRLTNLSMNGCCNLKELPKSIDGLSSLSSLALNDCWSLREVSGIRNLSQLTVLSMKGCRHPRELPESVGRLSSLSSLALNDCLSLQKVPLDIRNLSGLRYLYLTNCHDLRVLPESIGRVLSLGILFFHNCWNLQELPAAIGNLSNLSVYKCRNLRLLPMLEGCCPNMLKEPWQNFEDLPYYCWRMPYTVDNLPGTFTVTVLPDCYVCTKESPPRENLITLTRPKELPNLERLFVSGCMKNMMRHSCYKPPIPIDIIRQFHKLNRLSLSPSLGHGIDYNYENLEDVDPGIFLTEKEAQCWFHFIGRTYSSSSISGHIIPNPKYSYTLSQSEKGECFRLSQGKTLLMCVQVEDFPEKVMVRKLHLTDKQSMAERGSIDDDEEFAGYTAVVQEGGVISLTPGNISHEFFLREQKEHPLYSGFHVDIPTSPLRRIWKQTPIHIWGLSALDIANCNITNKYSHCNTCLMEEETGLSWKRRMRLFYDDHALELLRKDSKFRYVAVSVSGSDLQTMAGVCETCVSVVSYDQMGKSKVGQTYCINWTSSLDDFDGDFASTSYRVHGDMRSPREW